MNQKGPASKQDAHGGHHSVINTFNVALLIGLLFAGAQIVKEFKQVDLGFVDILELKWLDLKFKARGAIPTQERVAIAAVDEKSIEQLGRWPWNRDVIARLIRKLDEKGALAISFDVIFSEPEETGLRDTLTALRQDLLRNIPPTLPSSAAKEEEEATEDGNEEGEEDEAAPQHEENETPVVAAPAQDNAPPPDAAALLKDLKRRFPPLAVDLAHRVDQLLVESDRDSQLADALEETYGKVILGFFIFSGEEAKMKRSLSELDQNRLQQDLQLMSTSKVAVINQLTPSAPIPPYPTGPALRAPLPLFAEQTDFFGHFSFMPDTDGTLRWAMLVHRVENPKNANEVLVYPSLGLKSTGVLLGGDDHSIVINTYDAGVHSISLKYLDRTTGEGKESIIPTDPHGRLLIDHHGPKGAFPHYSIIDILEDKPFVDVKDKLVFIGATSIGIYDLRVTPFGQTFPGVEIHANIADSIIANSYLSRPYYWAWMFELGMMLFFAIAFGLIIHRLPSMYSATLCMGILVGYLAFDRYFLFAHGHWLRSVLLLIEAISLMMVLYIVRYFSEERERKRIRSMFGHYLNDDIIHELEKDPSKMQLGGVRKELTMLFSDIAGFTTISEKLPPEEITGLLNHYLTPMTNLVFENKGLLDKYIGDAVMGVFGTPFEDDHAFRACTTAVEMQKKVYQMQDKWKRHGIEHFSIRIGLNTGVVSVGNMGSEIRFDYTVIGDAVNTASRIEGINKQYGTGICITQNTYEPCKGRLVARQLDRVRVKGKKDPTAIYELIDIGSPSDQQQKWIAAFEQGLAAYFQQRWDEAEARFAEVSTLRGAADPPSEAFIKRIAVLRQTPPGDDWDGVWTMTSK